MEQNQLQKVEVSDIVLTNEELINEANSNAGVNIYNSLPRLPIIKINNKSEEKEIMVDERIQKVKFIKPGFLISQKNELGKYESSFFGNTLEGIILKRRYKISSKMDTDPIYYSEEFDSWKQSFKVFTGQNEIIFEGPYSDAKQMFQTGINPRTKLMDKSFNTFLILYINIDNSIYKFEWKMSGKNKWFDYEAEFKDDTFVRYKTQFILHEETKGDIDFYYVEFKKGEEVNLTEQLGYQKQINQFLGIKKAFKTTINQRKDDFSQPEQRQEFPSIQRQGFPMQEVEQENIPLDSIPF